MADEKDLVVTSDGKPIALLSPISEDSLEELLSAMRRARAQAAAAAMQQSSFKAGIDLMPLDAIGAEIAAARADRAL